MEQSLDIMVCSDLYFATSLYVTKLSLLIESSM